MDSISYRHVRLMCLSNLPLARENHHRPSPPFPGAMGKPEFSFCLNRLLLPPYFPRYDVKKEEYEIWARTTFPLFPLLFWYQSKERRACPVSVPHPHIEADGSKNILLSGYFLPFSFGRLRRKCLEFPPFLVGGDLARLHRASLFHFSLFPFSRQKIQGPRPGSLSLWPEKAGASFHPAP